MSQNSQRNSFTPTCTIKWPFRALPDDRNLLQSLLFTFSLYLAHHKKYTGDAFWTGAYKVKHWGLKTLGSNFGIINGQWRWKFKTSKTLNDLNCLVLH